MIIEVPNGLLQLRDLWDREEYPSDDRVGQQRHAQYLPP
jgi:hypothetical protein